MAGILRWRCASAARAALAALAALAAGALLAALLAPGPQRRTALLPRLRAATVAHHLADFALLSQLHPHIGSWSVEEEKSNYTTWSYRVSYSCGERCRGEARVAAHESHESHAAAGAAGGPRHGAARAHRVSVSYNECSTLPLLPWPTFCEKWETDTVVEDSAGGAMVREDLRSACGAGGALSGRCARRLSARADHRAHYLRNYSQNTISN